MSTPTHFLVFDVESVGLHGDGFAVGYVLVETASGSEVASGMAWCHPDKCVRGTPADRAWTEANVMPSLIRGTATLYECADAREVRDTFWLKGAALCPKGTVLAADVAWPVEARFLAQIIDDSPTVRNWSGPYPLIDIASVRLAKGFDPLATEPRRENELPAHNPLADARQSARLLLEALSP
jgi:hypothetical protein